jgi:protein-tyrosine phosphatase
MPPFVDIHCHLLPGMDDGPGDWQTALAMARMAVEDGIETVIVTPHQLGAYAGTGGTLIRQAVEEFRQRLSEAAIPLRILAGADVRVEETLVEKIQSGEVVTLGDHGKHVLLELPHEVYFPLEPLMEQLRRVAIVGVLSHPERNAAILHRPEEIRPLVERGCLMQVTANSLTGQFGSQVRSFAERLVREGLVHFVGSDAHDLRARPPCLRPAFEQVARLAGEKMAVDLFCDNPTRIARGEKVRGGRHTDRRRSLTSWVGLGR